MVYPTQPKKYPTKPVSYPTQPTRYSTKLLLMVSGKVWVWAGKYSMVLY